MRKLFVPFHLFALISLFTANSTVAEDIISLRLPQQVISQAVNAVLPYKIDTSSKSLSGDITIVSINEIVLADGLLTCHLHLKGDDLALETEIAGHKIKLNVGSTEIDFTTDAAVRFDSKQQILYIRPLVRELSNSEAGSKADIGQAIIALFNGQEFPIQMQKLEPLLANTGTKQITINSRIAYIAAIPKAIQIGLTPIITSRQLKKK